jgi:transcriptional regulator with XRE-family HTH domain
MSDDSHIIFKHQAVREARQDAGLTQAELAEQVGVKQSAVCQFEAGKPQVLKSETVTRMAEVLGIDLSKYEDGGQQQRQHAGELVLKYCSNDICIRSRPYRVGSDICFMPAMVASPSHEKTHCDSCREVLADHCPNSDCKAHLFQGAFCPKCGTVYVPLAHDLPDDVESWLRDRREDAREFLDLTGKRQGRSND